MCIFAVIFLLASLADAQNEDTMNRLADRLVDKLISHVLMLLTLRSTRVDHAGVGHDRRGRQAPFHSFASYSHVTQQGSRSQTVSKRPLLQHRSSLIGYLRPISILARAQAPEVEDPNWWSKKSIDEAQAKREEGAKNFAEREAKLKAKEEEEIKRMCEELSANATDTDGMESSLNVYGELLQSCGSNPGDGQGDYCKFRSADFGAHQVCISELSAGLSTAIHGTDIYADLPWCVSISKYVNYYLKSEGMNSGSKLAIKCDALPLQMLDAQYALNKWRKGDDRPMEKRLPKVIQGLCETCGSQATTEVAKETLRSKCEVMTLELQGREAKEAKVPESSSEFARRIQIARYDRLYGVQEVQSDDEGDNAEDDEEVKQMAEAMKKAQEAYERGKAAAFQARQANQSAIAAVEGGGNTSSLVAESQVSEPEARSKVAKVLSTFDIEAAGAKSGKAAAQVQAELAEVDRIWAERRQASQEAASQVKSKTSKQETGRPKTAEVDTQGREATPRVKAEESAAQTRSKVEDQKMAKVSPATADAAAKPKVERKAANTADADAQTNFEAETEAAALRVKAGEAAASAKLEMDREKATTAKEAEIAALIAQAKSEVTGAAATSEKSTEAVSPMPSSAEPQVVKANALRYRDLLKPQEPPAEEPPAEDEAKKDVSDSESEMGELEAVEAEMTAITDRIDLEEAEAEELKVKKLQEEAEQKAKSKVEAAILAEAEALADRVARRAAEREKAAAPAQEKKPPPKVQFADIAEKEIAEVFGSASERKRAIQQKTDMSSEERLELELAAWDAAWPEDGQDPAKELARRQKINKEGIATQGEVASQQNLQKQREQLEELQRQEERGYYQIPNDDKRP
eukprot:gnl/MRDRNA2_/MRDRNA2_27561_c0_seq1.p1 gnl/MRDRNA2_/MRDRNA2_27561_c0~~gnl/MRDRNA2_/MRDRNA2_27561_c0_seq1.p1  ORF type:complete len:862 (-),score=236.94 gnl/MRDRNA2_/MRDRNA2_27561_c0_seq1:121-2706(-)